MYEHLPVTCLLGQLALGQLDTRGDYCDFINIACELLHATKAEGKLDHVNEAL